MINTNNIKHILVSRTDNIGDVVLTLPLVGMLRKTFPSAKITFLAREYVRQILTHCPDIDAFYGWDALQAMDNATAIADIQAHAFDAVIHVRSNKHISRLMKQAGVPYRIGTRRRIYHWLTCNKRVNFSRAKSMLHEAQLNLKLLQPFNLPVSDDLSVLPDFIHLQCDEPLPAHIQSALKPDRFNVIIHPFSHGHAREWPISHFNALIRALDPNQFHVILTGSEKENRMIEDRMMSQCPNATNLAGKCNLRELMLLIANADALIANSTGPLHIAAALGIRVLGLYPITKAMAANRWGPLGKHSQVLKADPDCNAPRCRGKHECFCMESITVEQVKEVVMKWVPR